MVERKLPEWSKVSGLACPEHVALEQCSSEATAKYKEHLILSLARQKDMQLNIFVDLTGGFGVDCYYIGRNFKTSVYVEQNEKLCDIVRGNYDLLNYNQCRCINNTAENYLTGVSEADLIYFDPARRDKYGHRKYDISDCLPNVKELQKTLLEKAETVIVKLSPMFDWHKAVADMQNVREVHIVSVKNECKELLLIMKKENRPLKITCVNDDQIFSYKPEEIAKTARGKYPFWEEIKKALFLYEPNASIMKAGCFSLMTDVFGIQKISNNSHLFISDKNVPDFPGRSFQICAVSSLNRQETKTVLSGMNQANVAVRNFPMSAENVKNRLKLKDGGDTYVFATTTNENKHIIFVCKKKNV